ncbi:hypothetical protein VTH06DRAFT_4916 [Thermothelomyces fergusii]
MFSWPTDFPAFSAQRQDLTPFNIAKARERKWLLDTTPSDRRRRGQDGLFDREPQPGRPMIPVSASDWESKKQIIWELYIDQNMFLNEVIEIMITKYNFKATARMYKGQFAKWKWAKYNKPGKPKPARPTRPAAGRKKSSPLSRRAHRGNRGWQSTTSTEREQPMPLYQPAQLRYFCDEEHIVEAALGAYAAMISHWCEQETPWRPAAQDGGGGGGNSDDDLLCAGALDAEDRSILEQVRCAQDHFLSGRTQQGGDVLRRAFLAIETALSGDLTIEALWDCCLAVPQLALTTGWTDVLGIFVRYLHQYTSIRLPHHPIALVAASLCHLCRDIAEVDNEGQEQLHELLPQQQETPGETADRLPSRSRGFVRGGWRVWIDTSTRVRGRHDDVTIHLKRGYVTVVDPGDAMAGQVVGDFGRAVRASVRARGAAATTARTLELERLLGRMFLPLFTPERARAAEAVLAALVARVEQAAAAAPRARWDYLDRYLVFSARHFMSGLAASRGDTERAAEHARRCLESPSSSSSEEGEERDLFWVQTSCLVESRLRAAGMHADADAVREARAAAEAQGKFRRHHLAAAEETLGLRTAKANVGPEAESRGESLFKCEYYETSEFVPNQRAGPGGGGGLPPASVTETPKDIREGRSCS